MKLWNEIKTTTSESIRIENNTIKVKQAKGKEKQKDEQKETNTAGLPDSNTIFDSLEERKTKRTVGEEKRSIK